ncbi:hypothetical protein GBA52_028881 [Prunus armeniaca]|nr:hypothetical protein GBA52_028881 [Prunus armeniaca]
MPILDLSIGPLCFLLGLSPAACTAKTPREKRYHHDQSELHELEMSKPNEMLADLGLKMYQLCQLEEIGPASIKWNATTLPRAMPPPPPKFTSSAPF